MRILFSDISPGEEIETQQLMDRYGVDVLNTVDRIFLGDVLIEAEDYNFLFPRIHFFDLAVRLFESAFLINFREASSRRVRFDTRDGPAIFDIELIDQTIHLRFRMGANREIVVNGKSLRSGNNKLIELRLIEFNLICGGIFEESIKFFEKRFGHIDGIREAFYQIPFAENYEDIFINDHE